MDTMDAMWDEASGDALSKASTRASLRRMTRDSNWEGPGSPVRGL
jgi:hypothetical protein